MSVDGRNKGNRYERDVCRKLATWVCDKPYLGSPMRDVPLRKRSTSIMPTEGHWEGEGDILHRPNIQFPFSVECKKTEGWGGIDGFFVRRDKWPFAEYWQQCERQADQAGRIPMMVVSKNRYPDLVVLPTEEDHCAFLLSEAKRIGVWHLVLGWSPMFSVFVLDLLDLIHYGCSHLESDALSFDTHFGSCLW